MQSKYQTLKKIVEFVCAESNNPIDELLMMGFDPYQLVMVFEFNEDHVKASEVYRNGDWDLDQTKDPLSLELYEPFDAAIVRRYKLTKNQMLALRGTTVYTLAYNAYMDDKAKFEEDLFKGILDEHEDSILDEIEFLRVDEKIDAIEEDVESESEPNWIDTPLYLECANYAYEAGEMDSYKASQQANLACKEAIESEIAIRYNDNRLATKEAVDAVVSEFGWDRVKYVLAVTINSKDHDGRIDATVKAWAKMIAVAPEEATELVVDTVHPGLIDLFAKEVIKQNNAETQKQGSCIIGVTEHYVRKYYSEVHGWTPDARLATVYADVDRAREVWEGLDKKGFSRVFVPNFDPSWINDTSNKELSDAIDFLKIADPKYLAWYQIHAEASSKTKLIMYAQSLKRKSKKCICVLCPENVDNVLGEPWQYVDLADTDYKKPLVEIASEVNPNNPKTISLASDGEEYYLLVTGTDYELPLFKEENQTLAEVMENLLLGLK